MQNLDYLPFGEILWTDSAYTSRKFTGDERDSETNLDHTWFRQYSSQLGRWMHPDPAGLAAVDPANPQSWNRYAYVLNNPLRAIDPLGLDCVYLSDDGLSIEAIDADSDPGSCGDTGGYWVDGTVTQAYINPDGTGLSLTGTNDGIDTTSAFYNLGQAGGGPGSGLPDIGCGFLYQGASLTGTLCGGQFSPYEPAPTSQDYVRAIAQALPTVCGGGVFFYAGIQGKNGKAGTGGFLGYLGEWDSNAGYTHNGLAEVGGEHSAVGGVVNKNGVDSFVFVPAGPVGEYGGGVIGPSAIGLYAGTPEKFPVGIGGGAYLNITSNAGCQAVRSEHP